jgi:hypothetical protein
MMANELGRKAAELSMAWDLLLTGDQIDEAVAEPELIQTVRQIAATESEVSISADLENMIWTNLIAGTSELWRPELSTTEAETVEARPATPVNSISLWILRLAWMVAAGFAGGFAAGVISRLAMRLAGVLTVDRNRFMLTENGNQVGKITLDGTLFLGMLTGALGIVTILLYVLLRNRLPFTGWQRSLGFSVMLLAVFGYVLMDPTNEDYHLFGPAWLNVATFSSLYIYLGFFTSQIYEWGLRRNLPIRALAFRPALRFPVLGTATLMAGIGIMVSLSAMFVGAPGMIVVGLGGVAWLINRFALRDRLAALPAPGLVQTWGMLVVPGIIGFILTARGITEILLKR